MSRFIPNKSITNKEKARIQKELTIQLEYGKCIPLYPYLDGFSMPLYRGFIQNPWILSTKSPFQFYGTLRPQQLEWVTDLINYMKTSPTATLSCHTGAGKTIMAIYIASRFGLKTLVVINRIILAKQWKNAVENNTNMSVGILNPKSEKLWDFNIINIANISKISNLLIKVKFVILDELHMLFSPTHYRKLLHINPKYMIGLSATPYRLDEFHALIPFFLGDYGLYSPLLQKHKVFVFHTGFTPTYEMTTRGPCWLDILKYQARHKQRNIFITNLVYENLLKKPENKWLILVKLLEHMEILILMFKEKSLKISKVEDNSKDTQILIGTTQKIGVGFDDPDVTNLVIAADIQAYFIQYLGRCFRKPGIVPVIVDIVDNLSSLKKHYETRQNIYEDHGGIVKEKKISKYLKTKY